MDVQTTAIGIALIVSFFLSEIYGLAAGGMIVPGYLALCLNRPTCVVITLLAALLTFAVVKLISQWAIVYGRRRIVLTLIIGFLVGAALRALPGLLAAPTGGLPGETWFAVIGFIIPGLIALWIDRQGLVETISPLLTSTVVVRLALIVIGMEVLT
jgi:poly-gamma-glutamate biosynthesis protein PgsC/CapC